MHRAYNRACKNLLSSWKERTSSRGHRLGNIYAAPTTKRQNNYKYCDTMRVNCGNRTEKVTIIKRKAFKSERWSLPSSSSSSISFLFVLVFIFFFLSFFLNFISFLLFSCQPNHVNLITRNTFYAFQPWFLSFTCFYFILFISYFFFFFFLWKQFDKVAISRGIIVW